MDQFSFVQTVDGLGQGIVWTNGMDALSRER